MVVVVLVPCVGGQGRRAWMRRSRGGPGQLRHRRRADGRRQLQTGRVDRAEEEGGGAWGVVQAVQLVQLVAACRWVKSLARRMRLADLRPPSSAWRAATWVLALEVRQLPVRHLLHLSMLATSRRPSPRCYRYIHLGVLVVMPSAPSAPSAPSPQSSAVQRAQCLRSATYGGPAHSPRTSIFPAIRRRGGDALFLVFTPPGRSGPACRLVYGCM